MLSAAIPCAFVIASLASVGCQSGFMARETPTLQAQVQPGTGGAPVAPQAKVIVEMHPDKGESKLVERPLTEPTSVQQMLVQSGATKNFRRLTVDLVRPLPTGGYHKIALSYNRESKRMNTESDYALQPGDRLIIIEDTTTMFDDAMQKVGAPFGVLTPKRGTTRGGGSFYVEG